MSHNETPSSNNPNASLAEKLSIMHFTNNYPGLTRKNFGAIELMIILSCEKCKSSKITWLSAMELISAASLKISTSKKPSKMVVVETETGKDLASFFEMKGIGYDFVKFERELWKNTSVLSQLLWKYNLMRDLAELHPELELREGQSLDWAKISFTQLRTQLLHIFSNRDHRIAEDIKALLCNKSRSSDQNGLFVKSHSFTHLDERPTVRLGIHDSIKRSQSQYLLQDNNHKAKVPLSLSNPSIFALAESPSTSTEQSELPSPTQTVTSPLYHKPIFDGKLKDLKFI